MPLKTFDTFQLGLTAKMLAADPDSPLKVINDHGGTIYYSSESTVSTASTAVTVGSSFETQSTVWIISASESSVMVEHLSGKFTATGGVSASSGVLPGVFAGNYCPATATSGTDTFFAEKKLFLTSVFLPANKTIKGIGFLVGSVGGTNKAVAGLFSSSGALLAHSSETTEGTTVGTAAEIQELALTSEYQATGPALYYIGVTANGGTAKFRAIAANTAGNNIWTSEVTLATKNALAAVTAPTTWTAGKGVTGFVY